MTDAKPKILPPPDDGDKPEYCAVCKRPSNPNAPESWLIRSELTGELICPACYGSSTFEEKLGIKANSIFEKKLSEALSDGTLVEAETFTKGNTRITVKKKDGEWIAAYYVDGKYDDDKTYYAGGGDADSKKDAIDTAKQMLIGISESKGRTEKRLDRKCPECKEFLYKVIKADERSRTGHYWIGCPECGYEEDSGKLDDN